MHRSAFQALSILLLGVALLSACQTEGQPSGVTTAPLALTPTDSPSELGSSTTDSNTTSTAVGTAKPVQPGVVFRDDFDGPAVDTSKWRVYEKSGVVRQRDGWLEVASLGEGQEFPYVLTSKNIIPESGGWYLETQAQWFNAKNESLISTLNVDVLPPSGPKDAGYAAPTIQVRPWYYKPKVIFRTGSEVSEGILEDNSGGPFTLRIECDSAGTFQVRVNKQLVSSGQTTRRPQSFWIGHYPNAPQSGDWLHWRIDYVETGRHEGLPPNDKPDAVDETEI